MANDAASSAGGFFVLTDDGSRYGPADIPTLNQWISDGRVGPTTTIEDSESGVQMTAKAVNGLRFGSVAVDEPGVGPARPDQSFEAFQSQLVGSRTPRKGLPDAYVAYDVLRSEWKNAWVCTIAAPIVLLFCNLGFILAVYGFYVGYRLRNEQSNIGLALALPNAIWILGFAVWCVHTGHYLPFDIRL